MADLAIADTENVRRVTPRRDSVGKAIAAVTIAPGDVLYLDATSGKAKLGDGSTAATAVIVGVALNDALAGQAVEYLKSGKIGGFTVSGLSFGDYVYLSDTAGKIADAAGTVSLVLGQIVASTDDTPVQQLYIDINYSVVGV
jgi:predicted RecA/RadA family phage recombinase